MEATSGHEKYLKYTQSTLAAAFLLGIILNNIPDPTIEWAPSPVPSKPPAASEPVLYCSILPKPFHIDFTSKLTTVEVRRVDGVSSELVIHSDGNMVMAARNPDNLPVDELSFTEPETFDQDTVTIQMLTGGADWIIKASPSGMDLEGYC